MDAEARSQWAKNLEEGDLPAISEANILPGYHIVFLHTDDSVVFYGRNQAGLSAESMPGQTISGARQYNLNLAGEQAALHLRMTQASATHWQLRLSADAATRQQLGPHVERLRERLRERQQGQHTADFDLEDDIGG